MTERTGKVYLVGAGPGDVAYLTVKAQHLLVEAEVLVYDALVDAQLLELVPESCLKLDVGKRGGQPSTPQAEINQLLVEHCQQGKQVVRLKSGDPFIFGRSTSEIQALIAAGCPFEVVPGISSALAAPLLAGIPLTDPVMSRGFTVITAHEPDVLDWEALARMETLVILMGGRNLGEIVYQLHRYGRSLSTPVAAIRWAGTPQQQVWTATLGTIVEQTRGESLSPSVITIGEVVGLREYLRSPDAPVVSDRRLNPPVQSSESSTQSAGVSLSDIPMGSHSSQKTSSLTTQNSSQPLAGKTILVTRAAGQSGEFCLRLQEEGATVIEMPTLEITPPSSWEELDRAIAHLSDFDWLILTSSNGVDYFFERLEAGNQDARALAGVKIAVVGKKTAQSLKQQGLQPDFIPPDFVADSLVEYFPELLEGKKILFPRVETGGREVLVKELTAQGAEVIEVAAYQSQCPKAIAPAALDALQRQAVDVITFASSKTVQFFGQLVGEIDKLPLQGVCIASIGPQTSNTCLSLLGRVDVEAPEYTLDGLTQAIVQWATSEANVRDRLAHNSNIDC
ncbi:uroporphyrinogen-III C-methyltransferase [Trichocoleus sp. ST-U3]|uniref:uroporphyrinogen-III C-methyltransferase n=1 Tax=Coleofasciculus sp. FACHB-542 TaxID=2692787 RepID=UPI001686D096|nr:uroporphyrinogen-III C-methyltransferase [Coleofasciculus sp. FACHB-542]MBD2087306.1 uroporphyrinogen-III C-methyltransferase [Coleofasciculus sp. FACHB-542]